MSYYKNVWETGDLVTATKLNKIEQGIEDNDTAIGALVDDTLAVEGKAADAKATGDALATKVPATRTVAGKALSSDVTLGAADISYNNSTTYASGTVGDAIKNMSNKIFWCEYGVTTYAEIVQALNAGFLPCTTYSQSEGAMGTSNNLAVFYEHFTGNGSLSSSVSFTSLVGSSLKIITCDSSTGWATRTETFSVISRRAPTGKTYAYISLPNMDSYTEIVSTLTPEGQPGSANLVNSGGIHTAISGCIAKPESPNVGDVLVWDGTAWVAQSLSEIMN